MVDEHQVDHDKDEEEVADHLEDIAAYVIKFSIKDDSSPTEDPTINNTQLESEDNPTCFLATLMDSITAHSLTT